MRRGAALLLILALTGCKLVDQNTFNPHAGDAPVIPPAKPVVAPPAGPPPLLVIDTPDPAAYGPPLRKAVADARARKPGVVFDVVEIQPPDTPPETPLGNEAAAVARMIVAQGVRDSSVRLIARPEQGGVARQVRVYVR